MTTTVAVGVGASRGCPEGELEALVGAALDEAGLAWGDVDVVASAEVKADEPAVLALGAAAAAAPRRVFFAAEALARVAVPTPSAVVAAHVGTPSVAEAAALLACGVGAELLVEKRRSEHATCAVARS
jgi:cobalt-precorrin 5A hydrolase/cobalt-precorrin 5A hydrolase/precorrin-3B C17-methyltransferase